MNLVDTEFLFITSSTICFSWFLSTVLEIYENFLPSKKVVRADNW